MEGDALQSIDRHYETAGNHSVQMSMQDAEALSRLLARRIAAVAGTPDLVVGLANGANMLTVICGEELKVPAKIVCVRRQSSRIKQKLVAIKDWLHIPSSWVYAGPVKELWAAYQRRHSKLESTTDTFDFDVRGLHVAVVDDCIVSGNSLLHVSDRIAASGAKRVTTAAICWTEEGYGGTLKEPPGVFLHRKIQWYPWSNNSPYWPDYLQWLKEHGIEQWT